CTSPCRCADPVQGLPPIQCVIRRMKPQSQLVDQAREPEVVLGQATGGVRAQRQGDPVPADRDVGVVVLRLRDLGDPVTESHRLLEVPELHGLDDLVAGDLPAGGAGQLPLQRLGVQQSHVATPLFGYIPSRTCCRLWRMCCGSMRSGVVNRGWWPGPTALTRGSGGCTSPRSPTSPTCCAAASWCSPPASPCPTSPTGCVRTSPTWPRSASAVSSSS